MARVLAALFGGVLLGIAGTYLAFRADPATESADDVVRDIVSVPKISDAAVEVHRAARFEELQTIEQVLALPDSFSRAEALHAIAGRADAMAVQDLIFDANRIADEYDREVTLHVLFLRLIELDPPSALALAQTEFFNDLRSLEHLVWRSWARSDLDEALFAARTQGSRSKQEYAAQGLYSAYGWIGTETTDYIEAELGIAPNRSTRSRYLYRLADRSVEEAVAFIEGVSSLAQRNEYLNWLGWYLTLKEPAAAEGYAVLFQSTASQRRYRQIVESYAARENPRQTLDRVLASGESIQSNQEFWSAARALIVDDPDAARMYFENARSNEVRRYFGGLIASQLAHENPLEALAWARATDPSGTEYLEIRVLSQIAENDPQLAMLEAANITDATRRSNAVSNIVQHVTESDPEMAASLIDQIENPASRREAMQQLTFTWMRKDADSAVEWILAQEDEELTTLLQQASHTLVRHNLDAALRLLPRIDDEAQGIWRLQIAKSLATARSVADAQAFVRQYEGQPGYEQLQASVIQGVAETDTLRARQMADQLVDRSARDRAYRQIIALHANRSPAEAVALLDQIDNESMRNSAVAQIAGSWYSRDPRAATRWVNDMPRGAGRDNAILQMSHRWSNASDEQVALINSIGDRDKRGQAKVRRIYSLMRTDPVRARQLLADEDIPDSLREQAEANMRQMGTLY